MPDTDRRLAEKLEALLSDWKAHGLPGRATLHEAADDLLIWRGEENVPGLWKNPPLMLGATLDDGWGHGIQLILKFAKAMGCRPRFLGNLCPIDTVVEACEKDSPDLLGLTILQFDTEEALRELTGRLPEKTRVMAGGPVFSIDPDLAERCSVDIVARDARHFIKLMMEDADHEFF